MKKPLHPWNIISILNPKLDNEVLGLESLYQRPASEGDTPAENLVLMVSKLIHMSKMLSIYVTTDDTSTVESCQRLAEEIHLHEKLATTGLYDLAPDMSKNLFKMVFPLPSRMERISLNFKNILNSWHIKTAEGIPVSDEAQEELVQIFLVVIDMLENLRDALLTPDKFILEQIMEQRQKLTRLLEDARGAKWERLQARMCLPQRASIYVGVLDSFRNVNEYITRMCDSVLFLILESEAAALAKKTDP